MKRVLIFGCAGFVGNYLAEEFLTHGYDVVGSGIEKAQVKLLAKIHSYEQCDLLDYDKVKTLIKSYQPDYIINLAAISSVALSWKIPQKTIDVNVNGSLNILEAVRESKTCPKILLIGSSEEYAISDKKIPETYEINANNPYGISKVTQEHFSELYRNEYGMKIINTRTFNHTGIGQPDKFVIPSFVKQVANIHNSHKPGVIKVGNLGAHRDLGDVRDMTSAYRMILESNTTETVFNIGSGTCYHLEEILKYIISLSDQPIKIELDREKLRPLDNPIIWCDNSKIKSEIGWMPKYTVFDAIDRMFANLIV